MLVARPIRLTSFSGDLPGVDLDSPLAPRISLLKRPPRGLGGLGSTSKIGFKTGRAPVLDRSVVPAAAALIAAGLVLKVLLNRWGPCGAAAKLIGSNEFGPIGDSSAFALSCVVDPGACVGTATLLVGPARDCTGDPLGECPSLLRKLRLLGLVAGGARCGDPTGLAKYGDVLIGISSAAFILEPDLTLVG